MNYRHTIQFKSIGKKDIEQVEVVYQKASLDCAKICFSYSKEFGGLAGFSAHCLPGRYKGLQVNGSLRTGKGEIFTLKESYLLNEDVISINTHNESYDSVITACIITLKFHMNDLITVLSDGKSQHWNNGLILARNVLGIPELRIPKTIEVLSRDV